MEHKNQPLFMIRDNLNDLPEAPLPAGVHARWYLPGDEQHWLTIHKEADLYNDIHSGLFREQFGDDLTTLTRRQCYLLDADDQPIGTATAWCDEIDGRMMGRVHWVAITPAWQGKGLAMPLLRLVCERLKELGHGHAFLTTSPARLEAINLYLKFGFRPYIRSEDEQAVWQNLAPKLKYPIASTS